MASVGGVTVLGFKGRMFAAGRRSTELDPGPGYTGSVIVHGAAQGDDTPIRTTIRGTLVALEAQAVLWLPITIEGTVVTVIDGAGVTWANALVRRCRNAIAADPIGYYMHTDWLFRVGV